MLKLKTIFLALVCTAALPAVAQHKTENLIVVTLDGMRWEEVFGGADSAILKNKKYTRDSSGTSHDFWTDDSNERRKKLFPFLWSTVATEGQLYGNRWKGSQVNNANRYWFSYPGYNEIFTGYPDTAVNSNDKVWNPNTNVLEFINQQKKYTGKVAAFSTWDVFPYILNTKRSGLYVNADVDTLHFNVPALQLINDMQYLTTRPIGVRPDVFTYFAGREYLKTYQPKVLYIAFDETDDFAHAGEYDQYLKSAHAEDAMIADLWNYIQHSPVYKDKTTLIVTCDHGRGDILKDNWRHHGSKIEDAGQIWIAAIGPDTKPLGEVTNTAVLYQKQLAATFAQLLGFTFTAPHPIGAPIESIYKK
ncbi:MAG: alkaline phosphatase family protein [Bacteroidetes bacterium]|nr:alkaline phosphatase family protein [Bacteroidota bacterium]